MGMSMVAWLLGAALLAWCVVVYNRMIRLRNQVRAGWSDIDVQLARRHDLVPMLVEAVRGYTAHERVLLENVTRLRAEALTTDRPARLAGIEGALEQQLGRLLVVCEAYPDLGASANFLKLQSDLVGIEDHLQYARRFYNGAVRAYNDSIQHFPPLVIARICGFQAAEFYSADEASRIAPIVTLQP